ASKELNVNKPAGCLVSFEKIERISSIIRIYVACVERVEIPILSWSTMIVSGYLSMTAPNINELFPVPETPQIETNIFLGMFTLMFFKLLWFAFFIVKLLFISLGFLLIFIGSFKIIPVGVFCRPSKLP